MFASNKTVKALEYRVIELETQLQKLQETVTSLQEHDIEEQVREAINDVDLDGMAENAIERLIDNAQLQIRF